MANQSFDQGNDDEEIAPPAYIRLGDVSRVPSKASGSVPGPVRIRQIQPRRTQFGALDENPVSIERQLKARLSEYDRRHSDWAPASSTQGNPSGQLSRTGEASPNQTTRTREASPGQTIQTREATTDQTARTEEATTDQTVRTGEATTDQTVRTREASPGRTIQARGAADTLPTPTTGIKEAGSDLGPLSNGTGEARGGPPKPSSTTSVIANGKARRGSSSLSHGTEGATSASTLDTCGTPDNPKPEVRGATWEAPSPSIEAVMPESPKGATTLLGKGSVTGSAKGSATGSAEGSATGSAKGSARDPQRFPRLSSSGKLSGGLADRTGAERRRQREGEIESRRPKAIHLDGMVRVARPVTESDVAESDRQERHERKARKARRAAIGSTTDDGVVLTAIAAMVGGGITKLAPIDPQGSRWGVWVDESLVARLSPDMVLDFKLVVGQAWTTELAERVETADQWFRIESKAIATLARGDRTVSDLRRRLLQSPRRSAGGRGGGSSYGSGQGSDSRHSSGSNFSNSGGTDGATRGGSNPGGSGSGGGFVPSAIDPAVVDAVIAKLVERGLVNDEDFAKHRATHLLESGKWGARGVVQRLVQRGVSRELAQQEVKDHMEARSERDPDHDPIDDAVAVIQTKATSLARVSGAKQTQRIWGLLQRRGFGGDVIPAAIARWQSQRRATGGDDDRDESEIFSD